MYKMKQNFKKIGFIIVSQFFFNTTNFTNFGERIPPKKDAPSTTQWQHSIVDINFLLLKITSKMLSHNPLLQ